MFLTENTVYIYVLYKSSFLDQGKYPKFAMRGNIPLEIQFAPVHTYRKYRNEMTAIANFLLLFLC